jgi:hypothetical protein
MMPYIAIWFAISILVSPWIGAFMRAGAGK